MNASKQQESEQPESPGTRMARENRERCNTLGPEERTEAGQKAMQIINTPATPSADEEIERSGIADKTAAEIWLYLEQQDFGNGEKAIDVFTIRQLIERALVLSHANEREEWIKRSEEWRINAEEKRNHLKTAEATLAAREGELEWMTADRDVATKDRTDLRAQLSTLQAELATAQEDRDSLARQLQVVDHALFDGRKLNYKPDRLLAIQTREKLANEAVAERDSLRSQLTEAQAEKERIRGQLISHERMAASGVYVETEKYAAMVAQLTEAQSKRDQWGKELGEAQQAIDTLTRQLKGVEGELVQARCSTQVAEDDFIDRLFSILNERGIDTSNWDGEDDSAVIIANNIVSKLSEANAKLAEVEMEFAEGEKVSNKAVEEYLRRWKNSRTQLDEAKEAIKALLEMNGIGRVWKGLEAIETARKLIKRRTP